MKSDPYILDKAHLDCIEGVQIVNDCPSTNEIAKQIISFGQYDRFVIASCQTAGRGSRNRVFVSEIGGLYISYAFLPNITAEEYGLYVMAAGVAVCRVLIRLGFNPCLKYPNDVVLNGKKVCGILLENVFGVPVGSVLGIGINVYNDVSVISDVACSLSMQDPTFDIPLGVIAAELAEEIRSVCGNPRECLEQYRILCKTLGHHVTIQTAERKISGIAEDMDSFGRLIVCTKENKRITADGSNFIIDNRPRG